jgi:activator of HSP90 ATPase
MDIRKTYVIAAPNSKVWAALTDPDVIERWGGGPADMAAEPDSAFSLWGGSIFGTVVDVDPGRSMMQEWYGGNWDDPSIARFTLTADASGGTRLELENTGVPDEDAPDIDAGWDDYYLGPIKTLLEGGKA